MKLAAAVVAAFLVASSVAADEASKRSIQVRGTGSVTAAPDRVSFFAGVETDSPSLKTAFADNKRIVQAVLKALRDHGVTDAQMRTANFSINVGYEDDRRTSRRYRVSNGVTVTRDKTDDVATLIEAAVDAGANNVSSVVYSISDSASLRDTALDRAFADAHARAAHLAAAAGRALGDPIEITTEVFYTPPVVTEAITVAPSPGLEMQAGLREVTSTILVTFELK
jgi:uncharacterized protein YggE